jgi:hypothetical protein
LKLKILELFMMTCKLLINDRNHIRRKKGEDLSIDL